MALQDYYRTLYFEGERYPVSWLSGASLGHEYRGIIATPQGEIDEYGDNYHTVIAGLRRQLQRLSSLHSII